MSDSSSLHEPAATEGAARPAAEARAPRTGRKRTAALIVGGALLFAGGAGTGAVVGTALSPASAQTAQSGPGGMGGGMGQPPTGQMPGGTGSGQTGTQGGQSGTQQAPSGAAPSTAPSTSSS